MIVIQIQTDKPNSAISLSKAKQLRDLFAAEAKKFLGSEWIVFCGPQDPMIKCLETADMVSETGQVPGASGLVLS